MSHNGGDFLPRTLAALADQTRPADSVIGVDTGSRDDSAALLEQAFGKANVTSLRAGQQRHGRRRAGPGSSALAPWPADGQPDGAAGPAGMDLAAARRCRPRAGGPGRTAPCRGARTVGDRGRLQAAGLARRAPADRRRALHQPLGRAADPHRRRRTRPGPVRRPHATPSPSTPPACWSAAMSGSTSGGSTPPCPAPATTSTSAGATGSPGTAWWWFPAPGCSTSRTGPMPWATPRPPARPRSTCGSSTPPLWKVPLHAAGALLGSLFKLVLSIAVKDPGHGFSQLLATFAALGRPAAVSAAGGTPPGPAGSGAPSSRGCRRRAVRSGPTGVP